MLELGLVAAAEVEARVAHIAHADSHDHDHLHEHELSLPRLRRLELVELVAHDLDTDRGLGVAGVDRE